VVWLAVRRNRALLQSRHSQANARFTPVTKSL
jgi:hypothetical protein